MHLYISSVSLSEQRSAATSAPSRAGSLRPPESGGLPGPAPCPFGVAGAPVLPLRSLRPRSSACS
jgi:hypothetical protein